MSKSIDTVKLCPVSGQSAVEEVVNSLTHGVGFVLALAGLSVLVILACLYGTVWHLVSFSIYGVTLVLLYGASMVYHRTVNLKYKRHFQTVDHICIYLLIAGTYTPFMLVTLRGGWGWSLFGVIWTLAGLGIVLELLFKNRCGSALSLATDFDANRPLGQQTGDPKTAKVGNRYDLLNTLIYLTMAWVVVGVGLAPLRANLATGGLVWLIAGGAAYSVGTVFYLWEKIPFNHALWHLFVLAGSICHFCSILFFVLFS